MNQHSTPRYKPKRNENVSPRKNFNKNVHNSIIYNSPNVEITQMPIKL